MASAISRSPRTASNEPSIGPAPSMTKMNGSVRAQRRWPWRALTVEPDSRAQRRPRRLRASFAGTALVPCAGTCCSVCMIVAGRPKPEGWRLAPAFDLNPTPGKPEHELSLDGSIHRGDLAVLRETAPFYRVSGQEAAVIIGEVRAGLATWRDAVRGIDLGAAELDVLEDAIGARSGRHIVRRRRASRATVADRRTPPA